MVILKLVTCHLSFRHQCDDAERAAASALDLHRHCDDESAGHRDPVQARYILERRNVSSHQNPVALE